MVAQQILVLFVKVRVLMRQLKGAHCAPFFMPLFLVSRERLGAIVEVVILCVGQPQVCAQSKVGMEWCLESLLCTPCTYILSHSLLWGR